MSHEWDEFSKSLSDETIPRRESLRRFGAIFAGAILSPFSLGAVWAGPKNGDPCKAFCKCRNKTQQSQCISACRDCDSDPRFLCGNCSEGYACTDLANDPWNCGACYRDCGEPGPNEYVACVDGTCKSNCVSGAVRCDGTCTDLEWDPANCGACGHICDGQTPFCSEGECSDCPGWLCGGLCVNLLNDPYNCGACGVVCGDDAYCAGGVCQTICIPNCSGHACGVDDGCGGLCGCPPGMYCEPYSNTCAISEPTDF